MIPGASSEVNFYETQATAPFAIPERGGRTRLLEPYLNLDPVDCGMLIVWTTFVLAHAKQPGVAFPLLVLGGEQGAGKTSLCNVIQLLTDPSFLGVQSFPRNERDFAVTTQASSVVFYDNVRMIGRDASDMLCRAASGGMFAIRKLFSDAGVMTLPVHGAIVLNGIHEFIVQPDLAQRSLRLNLRAMDEKNRRSERAMREQFARELPRILGALLDIIAGILTHLPDVQPEYPERMIEFVRWMAAYERHLGAPNAPYQSAYSAALRRGMRSSLEESPLVAAIFELMDELGRAEGSWTPSDLYAALGKTAGRRAANSRDWPLNPSAMSKRLKTLQAALRRQGIDVQIGRRQERRITITRLEESTDD